MKTKTKALPWKEFDIVCKDGMYYYYAIVSEGSRRLVMTYSKDLTKEQEG